ncbi:MAG: tryptophan synthase subunit alpha [Candidatus Hydrothermarchaeaceae archaeon]
MSRIAAKFAELDEKGEGALIGYLTLGDPDIKTSEELIASLLENVDIMELGIPFSDPIADGPTIQGAMERALKAGVNTDIAFEMVSRLRKRFDKPFVFMTYYNIVLQYGEEKFINRCAEEGVDGVLISDMPIEEAEGTLALCEKYGVDFVCLIAPTTGEERIRKIAAKAKGFLYLVALLGVTGAREKLEEETVRKTKWALRYAGGVPLAVGFGISKKEHVQSLIRAGAQGAVVGSAFVELIAERGGDAAADLKRLSSELKEGTKK